MTTLTDPAIESAKGMFAQARAALERAFAHTPDDRLNWSPSPTARTPVAIVAHAAWSLGHIRTMLDGRPYPGATTADADLDSLAYEREFSSRSEVLLAFGERADAYLAYLDSIPVDRLAEAITLPFGLGTLPLAAALPAGAQHTLVHAAQIEYVHTIYGDRDWHL